jgi:hypothetical protein
MTFVASWFTHLLRSASLLAPCTDLTGYPASGAFTSGLSAGWSPFPLQDITTTATGLLCWRDSHPLEWQLASLHLLLHRDGLAPSTPCRSPGALRIPALAQSLSEALTNALAGSAIVALIAASVWASYLDQLVAPAREAAAQAVYESMRAEQERVSAEYRSRDEAKFAALGPNSPLRDYLEYLNSSDLRARQALENARYARTRQADAVALLREPERDRLVDLRELWQLDIEATPELCEAYEAALRKNVQKIDPSYSNRLGEAIDLEFQLPNFKWLVAQHCNLSATLTDLARRLRVVRDSSRIDQLADTVEAFARQQ